MVEELFRQDAYLKDADATVTAVEERGVRLDRTIFYPTGGGQPGDSGVLRWDGGEAKIVDAVKADGGDVLHVLAPDAPRPAVGAKVQTILDWDRRYRHMRMHTALHVMSAVIKGNVTGGQVNADKSRLDFNLEGDVPTKEWVTEEINKILAVDRPVTPQWVTDEELNARPELVKTMSVRPPMGAGRVRLLAIEGVDLQACGGTHVARTGEIGRVECTKIENKGKMNRRFIIAPRPEEREETPMEYARPDALVCTDWLAARLDAPDIRVVDGSFYLPAQKRDPKAEFVNQHIPGAVFFDIDEIADTSSSAAPHAARRRKNSPRACASSGWATATRSWSTTPRR